MLTYLATMILGVVQLLYAPESTLSRDIVHQAIRSVAPSLPMGKTKAYARLVHRVTTWRRIDPLLLVAVITTESEWKPRTRSVTNDYGLTQVHVAARGSAKFLHREHELYDPATNLREWGRLADMWRAYHHRTCKPGHQWWRHLKWGHRIKDPNPGRLDKLYQTLRSRFAPKPEPNV